MNFLTPLAFAFAAAIPVVIVFYLLKRKRVVKLVSSTLLWQKFLADTQASAPFQKLRKNWLLYLQILLLTLAVLALARPFVKTTATPSQKRVVILDGSASMQATDETPSRFEKARAEALKWVDSLRTGDEMVVILAGANTEVRASATTDKTTLRRALENCQPSDSPTRLVPALKMAESLIRDLDRKLNPEIHLFSDGAVPELAEFENKALPLIYHKVGARADNLGITALDTRGTADDATQRTIYTSIANFSSNIMSADLELLLDGQLIETASLTIPAQQSEPKAFKAMQTKDGVFTIRLSTKDDLAADNEASLASFGTRRAGTECSLARGDVERTAGIDHRAAFEGELHAARERPAGDVSGEGVGIGELDVFVVLRRRAGGISIEAGDGDRHAGRLRGVRNAGAVGIGDTDIRRRCVRIEIVRAPRRDEEVFDFAHRGREVVGAESVGAPVSGPAPLRLVEHDFRQDARDVRVELLLKVSVHSSRRLEIVVHERADAA